MILPEVKRVPIETLLYSVGGDKAVKMFEKIESDQSPTEYHDMRILAEQIQGMKELTENMGRQNRELRRMLERKLMAIC